MEKDAINERILCELKNDGRISNAALAKRINLSPSACLRRVQELENSGVIKGYRAILDREKLGNQFQAYVAVGLSDHSKKSQKSFEQKMTKSFEVTECHNVTGSFEYFLRVETKNLKSYKSFHTEVLGTLPQVNSISTFVIINSPKD